MVAEGLAALDDADTVLVAGWCPDPDRLSPELAEAVLAAHARGARIVGVFGGVYVPAALGLLDGRRAAAHWECTDDLARRYPRVNADGTVLPVETIATRVGLSSAVNLRRRFRNALSTTPAAYRRRFRPLS